MPHSEWYINLLIPTKACIPLQRKTTGVGASRWIRPPNATILRYLYQHVGFKMPTQGLRHPTRGIRHPMLGLRHPTRGLRHFMFFVSISFALCSQFPMEYGLYKHMVFHMTVRVYCGKTLNLLTGFYFVLVNRLNHLCGKLTYVGASDQR